MPDSSDMPKVVFHDKNGRRVEVQAPAGYSAMEAAVDNGVEGIVAECGGACACATCHGYIADSWLPRLKPMDEMEDAMLSAATERRANSRLLCQIALEPGLDGLEITVADNGD